MHLSNIFEEEELDENQVMRKFRISELSAKPTDFYNLDAIIAVGYRANSKKGHPFSPMGHKSPAEIHPKGLCIV